MWTSGRRGSVDIGIGSGVCVCVDMREKGECGHEERCVCVDMRGEGGAWTSGEEGERGHEGGGGGGSWSGSNSLHLDSARADFSVGGRSG